MGIMESRLYYQGDKWLFLFQSQYSVRCIKGWHQYSIMQFKASPGGYLGTVRQECGRASPGVADLGMSGAHRLS